MTQAGNEMVLLISRTDDCADEHAPTTPHNPAISGRSPLFTCSVAEQLLAHGGLKHSWHRQIYEVIRRYAGNAARLNCQGSSVHVDQQMVCFNLQEMFIHFYFRMVFEARTICLTWPFRELLEGDIML